MNTILVTGGAGFIGSHTAVELLKQNYKVVIVDNLSNSSLESIKRIEQITGKSVEFYELDLLNDQDLEELFQNYHFDGVIHFAGLKAVGESVQKPLEYYQNNLISTLNLTEKILKYKVKSLIFSSSATVYGSNQNFPLKESSEAGIGITNPYGQSKYIQEKILEDISKANPDLKITILRYFNPIGAHESGLIGEDPNGIPNNLLPFVSQVAIGKLPELKVFGNDYPTPDGTGVRDYVHVVDLALGHIAALKNQVYNFNVYNLGTGRGKSVLEIITAFEKSSGQKIPYSIQPRRDGDLAWSYANVQKAKDELDWQAKLSIEKACLDSWNWQTKNPNGFNKEK